MQPAEAAMHDTYPLYTAVLHVHWHRGCQLVCLNTCMCLYTCQQMAGAARPMAAPSAQAPMQAPSVADAARAVAEGKLCICTTCSRGF